MTQESVHAPVQATILMQNWSARQKKHHVFPINLAQHFVSEAEAKALEVATQNLKPLASLKLLTPAGIFHQHMHAILRRQWDDGGANLSSIWVSSSESEALHRGNT